MRVALSPVGPLERPDSAAPRWCAPPKPKNGPASRPPRRLAGAAAAARRRRRQRHQQRGDVLVLAVQPDHKASAGPLHTLGEDSDGGHLAACRPADRSPAGSSHASSGGRPGCRRPPRHPPRPALGPVLQSEADETTEKFGLEAGLWKVWTSKNADGQTKAQQVRLAWASVAPRSSRVSQAALTPALAAATDAAATTPCGRGAAWLTLLLLPRLLPPAPLAGQGAADTLRLGLPRHLHLLCCRLHDRLLPGRGCGRGCRRPARTPGPQRTRAAAAAGRGGGRVCWVQLERAGRHAQRWATAAWSGGCRRAAAVVPTAPASPPPRCR